MTPSKEAASIRTPYDDEILALQKELNKDIEEQVESLSECLLRISPSLCVPDHLKELIQVLEDSHEEPQRVLVSIPPQHGKSTTIKHAYPYLLQRDPTRTHAYVTYGKDLANQQARNIQFLCEEAGVQIQKKARSIAHWYTEQGGGVVSTSIGGPLTGKKIDGLLVIDDPFKDRAEAESPTKRQAVWDWFTSVPQTRVHKTTSIVVVHTRWHQDDLIGRIHKDLGEKEGWKYINIPAINDEGEALWPDVHTLKFLLQQKERNEYDFAALYQGRPRPKGADVFGEPARFYLPDSEEGWIQFLHNKHLIIAVDPAASADTSSDFSVVLVMAKDKLGPDGNAWIIDVQRKQCKVPDFVQIIKNKYEQYKCRIAVEAVGGFKAVPQMMELIDPTLVVGKKVIEIHPTRDKFTRAQAVASAWNNGRVFVPVNRHWADAFTDEVQHSQDWEIGTMTRWMRYHTAGTH